VASFAGQGGQTAHEGAADTQYMNMHDVHCKSLCGTIRHHGFH
jgi:hypothetical protein